MSHHRPTEREGHPSRWRHSPAGRAAATAAALLAGGLLLAACGAAPAAGTATNAGASQSGTAAHSTSQASTACQTGPAGTATFTLAVVQEPDKTVADPTAQCWNSIKYTGMPNVSTGSAPAGDTGQFKVAWNAENLYVLAWVQKWPLYDAGGSAYENDTVEFYLAGDNTKQASYGPNDCQVSLTYTGDVAKDDACNTDRTFTPLVKVVPNKGYYAELAVPWTTLNVTKPAKGQHYAFSIAYDIADSSGNRLAQMQWAGGANDNWQSTTDWGTITLQ